MTKQEFFDQATAGLAAQGEKSLGMLDGAHTCLYRSVKSPKRILKCAIGQCIPDEVYCYEMEGSSVTTLLEKYPKLVELWGVESWGTFTTSANFLYNLQGIHDVCHPFNWPTSLKAFAQAHGLSTENLEKLVWEDGQQDI